MLSKISIRNTIVRNLRRTSPGSLRPLSTVGASSASNQDQVFPWGSFLAASVAGLVATTSAFSLNSTSVTSCEQEFEGDLPNFGSSSDPIWLGSSQGEAEDSDEQVVFRRVDTSTKEKELQDASSSINKGIRALETCLNTGEQEQEQSDKAPTAKANVLSTSSPTPEVDSMPTTVDSVNETVTTKNMYFFKSSEIETKVADKFHLFSTPTSSELASDIAHLMGVPLSTVDIGKFTDGETRVELKEHVRARTCYVVASTPGNDAVMELMLLVSALRRASVKNITAVIPYYGYSRQDRKTKRESIAAADLALLLQELGVDRVISLDLHNDFIRGFFSPRIPAEHLVPIPVAAAYFHEELCMMPPPDDWKPTSPDDVYYPEVTIVAGHEGQVDRAERFRTVLQRLSGRDIEFAFISKNRVRRDGSSRQYKPELIGKVQGRHCIVVDDIVNTGSTLGNNVGKLHELGATSIYAWATHGVFGPDSDAPEKIQQIANLDYLLISNSIMHNVPFPEKIRQLNVAPLLAEAIARALHNQSISGILDDLEEECYVERYDG
eukprot:Nitzschia sp. Nitz4//scaffold15_size197535//144502//146245//NITZ4_001598-RA/size197535-processed-gene-0.27-mRNA-1//1//CDS//3329537775//5171//frame0